MSAIEHRYVQVDGVTFHVAVSGPEGAPSVLCLHGFPEGWMSWRTIMGQLDDVRVYAPDLRGYPGTSGGVDRCDPFTLTDDIKGLIQALGLVQPVLVGHDWGGALAWIFAHRASELVSHVVVVNCTHPKTLVRAIVRCEDLQPFRVPWLYFFEVPRLPEYLMTTEFGRRFLRWAFLVREGKPGAMDRPLVDELVDRFQAPAEFRGPITWYRQMVATVMSKDGGGLDEVYRTPITAPVTAVWGLKDGALPIKVAMACNADAGCEVEWRPLAGVGHFVSLEAPERLAGELLRVVAGVARS
jgi:epoxide hydrolase 4